MRFTCLTDSLGHTPLVGLPRLAPSPTVRLWVKLEERNPTGSAKDRAAVFMVRAAEKDGLLHPGSTILESSSGNTAIALAAVARQCGYDLVCVVPEDTSAERRALLAAYQVRVHLSPAAGGSTGAIEVARELAAAHPDWVLLYQYGNPANARAHYETTGPELLVDLPTVTHFVAGLGTAGTLSGVGRYLREHAPATRVVAVEPVPGDRVCGLRNLDDGFVPELYDADVVDERRTAGRADAERALADLAAAEGLLAGPSTGAVLHVARQVAAEVARSGGSADIALLAADGGARYLSGSTYHR